MTNSSFSWKEGGVGARSLMSDMAASPWGDKLQRSRYRTVSAFSLVFFLLAVGCFTSFAGGPVKISRIAFLEKIYKGFLSRNLSEAEAIQCGLLEPYGDGRFHLDWPVSRGAAAKILCGFIRKNAPIPPVPGRFSDIATSSELFPVLDQVGGVFPPVGKDRFHPDGLLTEVEARKIIETILAGAALRPFPALPVADARAIVTPGSQLVEESAGSESLALAPAQEDPALEEIPETVGATGTYGRWFPTRFTFPRTYREPEVASVREIQGSEARRLGRLNRFVPADQLSPPADFSLSQASEGMVEVEKVLDSLEMNVHELLMAPVADEGDRGRVREALTQIGEVTKDVGKKLAVSEMRLDAVLLVDPASIEKCADLRLRIGNSTKRLAVLDDRIKVFLNPPEKETQDDD